MTSFTLRDAIYIVILMIVISGALHYVTWITRRRLLKREEVEETARLYECVSGAYPSEAKEALSQSLVGKVFILMIPVTLAVAGVLYIAPGLLYQGTLDPDSMIGVFVLIYLPIVAYQIIRLWESIDLRRRSEELRKQVEEWRKKIEEEFNKENATGIHVCAGSFCKAFERKVEIEGEREDMGIEYVEIVPKSHLRTSSDKDTYQDIYLGWLKDLSPQAYEFIMKTLSPESEKRDLAGGRPIFRVFPTADSQDNIAIGIKIEGKLHRIRVWHRGRILRSLWIYPIDAGQILYKDSQIYASRIVGEIASKIESYLVRNSKSVAFITFPVIGVSGFSTGLSLIRVLNERLKNSSWRVVPFLILESGVPIEEQIKEPGIQDHDVKKDHFIDTMATHIRYGGKIFFYTSNPNVKALSNEKREASDVMSSDVVSHDKDTFDPLLEVLGQAAKGSSSDELTKALGRTMTGIYYVAYPVRTYTVGIERESVEDAIRSLNVGKASVRGVIASNASDVPSGIRSGSEAFINIPMPGGLAVFLVKVLKPRRGTLLYEVLDKALYKVASSLGFNNENLRERMRDLLKKILEKDELSPEELTFYRIASVLEGIETLMPEGKEVKEAHAPEKQLDIDKLLEEFKKTFQEPSRG